MMQTHAQGRFWSTRWNVLVAVAAGAVLWLALWVFSEMVDDTPKGEFVGWDEPLLRSVRGRSDSLQDAPIVVKAARGITLLGGPAMLLSVSLAGLVWLAEQRRWRAGAILLLAGSGALLLTSALKHHFMRTRPSAVPHWVEESSWSFPSGHSLASAAIYLTLGILLARRVSGRAGQVSLIAGAFLLSFLIGLSRVYLGVHYPTDVLAGWSAGTAWAIICSTILVWWEHSAMGPRIDPKSPMPIG